MANGASTYTDRQKELMAEGYDDQEAWEIEMDEEGANRFYDELKEG